MPAVGIFALLTNYKHPRPQDFIRNSRINNGPPNEDKLSELVEEQCDILTGYRDQVLKAVKDGLVSVDMGQKADQLCADHINSMHTMFNNMI